MRSRPPCAPTPTSPYDLAQVLTSMGIGEAVVTVLSDKGAPTPVAWTRLAAPRALMSPAPDAHIDATVAASPRQAVYGQEIDRESAYEKLATRAAASQKATEDEQKQQEKAKDKPTAGKRHEKSVIEQVVTSQPVKSFAREAGRQIGKQILRSLFGVRGR